MEIDTGTGLLGRERAKALLEDVLRRSRAGATEAVLQYNCTALTRFAANGIHQNHADETPTLTVRAVEGTRVGQASTTRLDDAGVAAVVEQAEAIARRAPANAEFPGLPGPGDEPGEAAYSLATIEAGPDLRAAAAGVVCRLARAAGLGASGSVMTAGHELAVANSLGVFAYTPTSSARLAVVATGDDGSGYAEDAALDLAALDPEAIATRAVDIGRRAQHPVAAAPGDYTVILRPEAVADLMTFLARLGFGGQAVHEGRSFVAGKRGEAVLGANVTLWDDGKDPAGLPLPFDVEGMPRRRLSLIDRGVAGDVALDMFYAGRLGPGAHTNGHAVPQATDFYSGPIPANMFMAPGDATVEDMIAGTERGLLVTRFHYTRVVHPLHVIVTGMTRDGTFLIENGAVTRPVKNLRYTQGYLDALRDVRAIGRETRLTSDYITARVPALKIGSFTFTGVTE